LEVLLQNPGQGLWLWVSLLDACGGFHEAITARRFVPGSKIHATWGGRSGLATEVVVHSAVEPVAGNLGEGLLRSGVGADLLSQ
jgi:hypothetical protein